MHRERLRDHLVNSTLVRLGYELLLDHAGNGYHARLLGPRDPDLAEHLADSLDCFVSIDYRHLALHDYQREAQWLSVIDARLDLVPCLVPILHIYCILSVILEAKDHEKAIDDVIIRYLVVDDEYFALRLQFFGEEVGEQKLYSLRTLNFYIFATFLQFSFISLLLTCFVCISGIFVILMGQILIFLRVLNFNI